MTLLPGGSYFHHADSFALIRGGHLDICILAAYQVAANGDLAVLAAQPAGLHLLECCEGLDFAALQARTGAALRR